MGERALDKPSNSWFAIGRIDRINFLSGVAASPELRLRIASALVLVVVAGGVTIVGGPAFDLLWLLAAFVCFYEWVVISVGKVSLALLGAGAFALGFVLLLPVLGWGAFGCVLLLSMTGIVMLVPGQKRVWPLLGLIYCAALLVAMVVLRRSQPYGMILVFWLFAIVWMSDIAAYFTGRTLGGPKLMPRISPKKTWSGFVGGTAAGAAFGSLALAAFGLVIHWQHVALALGLSIASAAGDLGESAFKRHFGVKDSGSLIPGHGGLFDRLDGFIAASIFALLFGYARNSDPSAGLLAW